MMTQVIYPVPEGYRRMWLKCKTCAHIGFHDHAPRMLPDEIVLSCGHGQNFESIAPDEAIPHLLVSALSGTVVGTPSRRFHTNLYDARSAA